MLTRIFLTTLLTISSLLCKAEDWVTRMIRQGALKYKSLEAFNDNNFATGNEHQNLYVIELNQNWIEEKPELILLNKKYEDLARTMREFNNNRKDELRFYVFVVSGYEAQINEQFELSSLPPSSSVEKLESYINFPSSKEQLLKFREDINKIPTGIISEMGAKGASERILYFYGLIRLYKIEDAQSKSYKHENIHCSGGRLNQVGQDIRNLAKTLVTGNSPAERIESVVNNIINAVTVTLDESTPTIATSKCGVNISDLAVQTKNIKDKEYESTIKSAASLVDQSKTASQLKSPYLLIDQPSRISSDDVFTTHILPDKLNLLAATGSQKLYVVFKKVPFVLSKEDWQKFASDVYNQSAVIKSSNAIVLTVPYVVTECSSTNWLGLKSYQSTLLLMPAVYAAGSNLPGSMNSALAMENTSWEQLFDLAFNKIPKAHTAYDYKILWNGDLVYDGIETRSNVTGSANIREVRILIDERFFQLQQADAQYGICLSGTSQGVPGAANVNYDDQQICASVYNQKVEAILSSRADFRLVNKTNLVQGKLDEKIAQEFAQWYAKRKNWGLVATFSSPENEIFYGGKNPQNVEDALMLIDIASGVAAFVGADALFDGIGSYYAYVNGEYVLAATYGAAAAVPFFSSAVRRAVMDGGEYVLRTVKGSYVTRPKNVLGMNYLFEVRSNISHFMKVALDGKSFNKALQYKTDTKFIEALEDGLLADNQAIRAINEKPELVDEYYAFYTQTKGTLAEFIAKGAGKFDDVVKKLDNLNLSNLKSKASALDEAAKSRFADDIADLSDDALRELDDNFGLVDEWKKIDGLDEAAKKSSKPEWLKKIQDGNAFNKERSAFYPYNEVYVKRPDGSGYYRLDSYRPGKEIVSRKYSQLGDIQEQTAISYLNELKNKYPALSEIAPVPSSQKLLDDLVKLGQDNKLRGQLILEVPVQSKAVSQSIIDKADELGIVIRDINGKIY